MKKFLSVILSIVILFSFLPCNAQNDISVYLDGGKIAFDVAPEIFNGRTMVPLRKIFEALGADVYWDSGTNTVTATKSDTQISLTVGKYEYTKNGAVLPLDAPAYISNGRTLVPIRVISESFHLDVSWNGETRSVHITSKSTGGRLISHFIDVGQGDSIFIELPDKQCMLIDAGEKGNGTKINSYIRNLGYSKIDYLICTHPHSDHIGSMADVIKAFDIGNIYMPKKAHTTQTFTNLLDAIESKGKTIIEAKAGVSIIKGGGVTAEFVSPAKAYTDLNDISAVVLIRYMNSSFLFTGDIENTANVDISANIDVDVLKVAHHGSSNATSGYLLSKTTPIYAVISCGCGNSYGHPHQETISLLESNGIRYYRTDYSGDIVISTDGSGYDIKENKSNSQPSYAPSISVPSTNQGTSPQKTETNIASQVYKTKTGKKYHKAGCSSLSKSCIPITREAAEAEGLTPCKNCKP